MKASQYRENAFLILFEASFRNDSPEQLFQLAEEVGEIKLTDKSRSLVTGVLSQTEELDSIISSYSRKRALHRIARTDLILLRMALYELRQYPEQPAGIAVSEAVRLAEVYASPEDTAFINGVLGNYIRTEGKAE